jgi:predicted DNA-binding protein (MmcQ/YjbR family)
LTREEVEAMALGLPATAKVVQWGESDVYKVGGKVFALCGGDGLSFKVSPIGFEVLTSDGLGRQAPYFAKGQWVSIALERIPREHAAGWLATAHSLVAAKLTKKARAELGLSPPTA